MKTIILFFLLAFTINAQNLLLFGEDGVSYEAETLAYQTRVLAAGGEIIDLDAVNNLYSAGIDSITLSIGNSYGLKKDANNKITTYYGLSGNELDFIQADTSKSPTYSPAALNGYASATYDGTADYIVEDAGLVLGSTLFQADKATLTFIIKQNNTQAQNGLFDWSAPNTSNQVALYVTHSNNIYFDYGDESGGGRISVAQPIGWDDEYHIIQFYRHVNVAEIWVDGVRILDGTFSDDLDPSQTTTSQNPTIGVRAGSVFFKGEIVEILFTNGVTKASTIRTFMATKYGL